MSPPLCDICREWPYAVEDEDTGQLLCRACCLDGMQKQWDDGDKEADKERRRGEKESA